MALSIDDGDREWDPDVERIVLLVLEFVELCDDCDTIAEVRKRVGDIADIAAGW